MEGAFRGDSFTRPVSVGPLAKNLPPPRRRGAAAAGRLSQPVPGVRRTTDRTRGTRTLLIRRDRTVMVQQHNIIQCKPCPFCGGTAQIFEWREDKAWEGHEGFGWLECSYCAARGPVSDSRRVAIKEWDVRSPDKPKEG